MYVGRSRLLCMLALHNDAFKMLELHGSPGWLCMQLHEGWQSGQLSLQACISMHFHACSRLQSCLQDFSREAICHGCRLDRVQDVMGRFVFDASLQTVLSTLDLGFQNCVAPQVGSGICCSTVCTNFFSSTNNFKDIRLPIVLVSRA